MSKVIICGDRDWADREVIQERIRQLPTGTTIIHGGARGADTIAGEVAESMGIEALELEADWDQFGKAAGAIRNRAMLDMNPGLVIAFHDRLSKSKGTLDCIMEANRRGIPVEVWTSRTPAQRHLFDG